MSRVRLHLNVLPIVKKEFRQISRDRRALGILIFLPAFMLVMVGYALNFDVRHLAVAVHDEERSALSREFITRLTQSEYLDFVGTVRNRHELERALDKGNAHVVIVIPPDFSRKLNAGEEAKIQLVVDGSNSNTAATALGYLSLGIQEFSARLQSEWLERRGVAFRRSIELQPKLWYNPDLRSARFLVPGLFGLILMIVTVISTSLSIVREKETGTMEQLKISPLWSNEIILGKTVPYLLISIVAASLIMVLGSIMFDVTIKGNILLLYVAIVLFLLGGLGQGILISSVANTQQVAFFMSVLSSLLPSFILSGFIFPIKSMPVVLQVISNVIPTKFFLIAVRSIVLKGVGFGAVWDQFIYLALFALATLAISVARLKRELNR